MSRGKEGRQDGGMGADRVEPRGSQPAQRLHPEMAACQPYAELCTRVYTRTGKRAHLLPPGISPNTHGLALCAAGPEWFELWRGTGSQDEVETAVSLPLCRYCEKRAEAADADETRSKLSRYGHPERPW